MVIFDFEKEGTGTKHVALATSKCEPSGIFCRVQHPAKFQLHYFIIGGDVLNFVSHHCTCITDDIISDQICMIGKLEYLWNKKRYHKNKKAILLYFEKPFNINEINIFISCRVLVKWWQ